MRRTTKSIPYPCDTRGHGRWAGALALLLVLAGCVGADVEGSEAIPVNHLATPAGAGSGEPSLAVGPDGRVYMSWLEPESDSVHLLRFAILEGDEWSPARTIARGGDWFVNWADFPSIIALPDGRLAAHYLQRNPRAEVGYHYDVRIVQSSDGGDTWSDPIAPHRDGVPAEHGFVSLFRAGGDSLGAIWLDGRKSNDQFGGTHEMTLRYTTLAADGQAGPELEIDGRICDCCQTSVAHTASGPVVEYRDRTEAEIRDIYIARMVDGAWTAGRPVHDDGWEIAACPVNGPSVTADGDHVAVAWFTAAHDTARVLLAFSADGGATFGQPVRVDGGDPAGRVDVELLPNGDALVSWIERTGGEAAEVRIRTVTRDLELSEPVAVAVSSGQRASGFPRMARAGDRMIFAWTEPGDPSRVRVGSARLGEGE
jgi:hypothetical protein